VPGAQLLAVDAHGHAVAGPLDPHVTPLALDGLERQAGEDVRRLDRVFGDMDRAGGDDDAADVLLAVAADVKDGGGVLTEFQFYDGGPQADPVLEHRHVLARRDLGHAEDAAVGLPLAMRDLPRFGERGLEVGCDDHGRFGFDQQGAGGAADEEQAHGE